MVVLHPKVEADPSFSTPLILDTITLDTIILDTIILDTIILGIEFGWVGFVLQYRT